MKIKFAGVGSAFTTRDYYQANALVESASGKNILIDCGSDARFSLGELGITNMNIHEHIDAVYISHLHADHIGGMEWLAFCNYFNPDASRPKLYMIRELMREMWRNSLRGGLDSIEGKIMNLTDYFDCRPVSENSCFEWEGIEFTPIQTVHIMSGYKIINSYGLIIEERNPLESIDQRSKIFFTTDTQYCPNQIMAFYRQANVIFHDCETAYKSGVHAHYEELRTLPDGIRKKMWLYHYQPNPPYDAVADGFRGFVEKGQAFGEEDLI